jgi:hypothetical protein
MTRELLAAYADGELDAAARAAVEQWLSEHPEAIAELDAQRELSPDNLALWQLAEPSAPSEDTWAAVQAEVTDAVLAGPAVPTGQAWWTRPGTWVGVAASLLLVALGGWAVLNDHQDQPHAPPDFASAPQERPLGGIGVLPIATDDEVEVLRVVGSAETALPVGVVPLSEPIVLASEDDVEVAGVDPDPAWGFDGPVLTTAPGDMPMIFAAPVR